MPPSVVVSVPATSANLGPGFDSLGLALSLTDVVRVWVDPDVPDGRARVTVTGECADEVPRDERHLVVRALRRSLEVAAQTASGVGTPGVAVECRNGIPHGRGLGSSAAAVVSGLLAGSGLAARLAGRDVGRSGLLDLSTLLELATEMEGHPDNAAPALLGGLTVAWSSPAGFRATRATLDPGIVPVVFVPTRRLSTATARGLLPDTVGHADAARTAGRAALLMVALAGRPDLLLDATEEWLHQGYRSAGMPESTDLLGSLRDAGVPAVISGAGPSVLAFSDGQQASRLAEKAPSGWQGMVLAALQTGATLS